ncbi:Tex family protein [Telmatospirillum siberiense]|uniref:Small ribosomal subunit protein bS1 n=1 Tax=Telmatospirillum siberiense TaxID=382514 RepID=A0A2N3Q233_9PROT|nr:Tex family protein [Telmatospirillum siberiense]PKU26671.1 RNA-binding transcriptional accessory protein [Telmatospirillum siberiense]
MISITRRLAEELSVATSQVDAAVRLIDEGNTVPFIARYRKEATGGLDDSQLRKLDERLGYLREMDERRAAILKSIAEQGKLTEALAAQIEAADSKARLEDLYLPYKVKRRTKAQIAREAGLEPLADALLGDPSLDPSAVAQSYVDPAKEVPDVKAALDGARQILIERMAEDADLLGGLRNLLWDSGIVTSKVADGMAESGAKFSDYFAYREPIRAIPSHRALALFRGRNENVLLLKLSPADEEEGSRLPGECERRIAARFGIVEKGRPADSWLNDTVRWAWRVKIHLHLEIELMARLREDAEREAIDVFARNLKSLLLAAPAGMRPTIGLDPGLRTGVKLAVIDGTGKVVHTGVIHPHPPRNDWEGSIHALAALAERFQPELIAIGNGTASRETDRLASDLIHRYPALGLTKVVVSEAGASVYSASETAALEFPEMDVTLRGAVSIARRLQDPLAELVKIDPKAIGVGQYQHDVDQQQLGRSLDAVVEDCVNGVGVDVNTASAALLARVAGLGPVLARNIVTHRDSNGPFASRLDLKQVDRLGPKAFEQAAGFLRVVGGGNPLDRSAVHPEAYPVVERIARRTGRDIKGLIGDGAFLRSLDPADYTDERFGVPTITDIMAELEKPGRDPRGAFKTAAFKEGVEELKDLRLGMILEGTVTNVTNFGAFVDIGVHQDGLVHISMMADKFVKDPHTVVQAGDVVKVKVLEVDLGRKRIALSMRLDETAVRALRDRETGRREEGRARRPDGAPPPRKPAAPAAPSSSMGGGALAEAFARAKKR